MSVKKHIKLLSTHFSSCRSRLFFLFLELNLAHLKNRDASSYPSRGRMKCLFYHFTQFAKLHGNQHIRISAEMFTE